MNLSLQEINSSLHAQAGNGSRLQMINSPNPSYLKRNNIFILAFGVKKELKNSLNVRLRQKNLM